MISVMADFVSFFSFLYNNCFKGLDKYEIERLGFNLYILNTNELYMGGDKECGRYIWNYFRVCKKSYNCPTEQSDSLILYRLYRKARLPFQENLLAFR